MSAVEDPEPEIIDCVKAALRHALEDHLMAHAEVGDAQVLCALCGLTASAGVAVIGANREVGMFRCLVQ